MSAVNRASAALLRLAPNPRVTAAVVGSVGALLGLLKAAMIFLVLAVGIGLGGLSTNNYLFVEAVSNAALVVFCFVAVVGALFAGRGEFGRGAVLFVGAGGVLASTALYLALFAAIMLPVRQVMPDTPVTPNAFTYATWLAPAPLLLVAAVLAFHAHRGARSTVGGS